MSEASQIIEREAAALVGRVGQAVVDDIQDILWHGEQFGSPDPDVGDGLAAVDALHYPRAKVKAEHYDFADPNLPRVASGEMLEGISIVEGLGSLKVAIQPDDMVKASVQQRGGGTWMDENGHLVSHTQGRPFFGVSGRVLALARELASQAGERMAAALQSSNLSDITLTITVS